MLVYLRFSSGPPSIVTVITFISLELLAWKISVITVHLVYVTKVVKCQTTRMFCAPSWYVCRAGIAYSVICKVFTLNDIHITYKQWDEFMFRINNEIIVRQNNLIFRMRRQKSLFLRCCDTSWHSSFVIHWMKGNFLRPQNCSNFLQSSNAGSCNFYRNMRLMFGILGFVKVDRCCGYASLSLQCSRISWKQVEINRWTL